jgi:hypothetical protein
VVVGSRLSALGFRLPASGFRLPASVGRGDTHRFLASAACTTSGIRRVVICICLPPISIGMTWAEWQQLQKRQGIECADGNNCYVEDVERTYNLSFRKRWDEPLRISS